jgi:hypothetical protein
LEISPGITSNEEISRLRSDVLSGCDGNSEIYSADQQGKSSQKSCNPGAPISHGYLSYLGKEERYNIACQGGYVRLQNTNKIGGVPMLLVEMGGI